MSKGTSMGGIALGALVAAGPPRDARDLDPLPVLLVLGLLAS